MKPKILIVDDNEGYIEGVAHLLSEEFECSTAYTIKQGLLQAEIFKPDIILLDIELGEEIDGIDAISDFRKVCDAKIIMFSSIENELVKKEALEKGADDYFVKNPNVDGLIGLIWRYS